MNRRTQGFTLLELLIGLVLLSFILTLMFAGFRLAMTTWTAIESRLERSSDEQAGLALVRRLIGSIQPLRRKRQLNQPLVFSGQAERFSAVAPLTESVGLRLVELAIEPSPSIGTVTDGSMDQPGLQLVLRENALNYDTDLVDADLPATEGHRLINNIKSAMFSYFGAETSDKPASWHGIWTNQQRFPKLVRLHIERHDGHPIDLIVATIVNGDRLASNRITVGPQ